MKNLFVPYETALLLAEKGYNEPCFATYNKLSSGVDLIEKKFGINRLSTLVAAPLYQQAVEWLRDEHHVHVSASSFTVYGDKYGWKWDRANSGGGGYIPDGKTHYEALNIAITHALEFALEFIKDKKRKS